MTSAVLFAGLDRASFVAAFAMRLRGAGLSTPVSSLERFAAGLAVAHKLSKTDLYWLTRVSLLQDQGDLATFNAVYAAVFDFELSRGDQRGARPRRTGSTSVTSTGQVLKRLPVQVTGEPESSDGLPWASQPAVSDAGNDDESPSSVVAERLPAETEALEDRSFDVLSEEDLIRMGQMLEDTELAWPTRRGRRQRLTGRVGSVAMGPTLRRAARTGGEVLQLVHTTPQQVERRVVFLLDVSGSMESYVRAYLHTCRLLVGRGRCEVFAIGTDVHRLTTALRHRSASEAMLQATEAVVDPLGGTRLATCVSALLQHKTWGSLVRGSVVVVASDGWDTDPPEQMASAMRKLSLRAHSVVWLNPRSADPEFQPKVGAMAAAMPFCDQFMSGHSANAVLDVLVAIQQA